MPEDTVRELLDRSRAGVRAARNDLLALYRDRLRRLVERRLNRAVRARVDPSDIVQEALLKAHAQLDQHAPADETSFP